MLDILIKGGRVVDGGGNAPFQADLGIKDGRITAIQAGLAGPAAETIDIGGRVVTPGVIDIHSHADQTIFRHPKAETAVKQGVTTTVVGQCGGSAAPHRTAAPGVAWSDFPAFFRDLAQRGIGVNLAQCVGHGTVRALVMGAEGHGGERATPSAGELAAMRSAVAAAMVAGCFGLSTGLQYPPGRNARTDEVVSVMQAAAPGIYATHMREQGAKVDQGVAEAIEVAARAGCKAIISHLKLAGPGQWGGAGRLLGRIEAARAQGVDVGFDVYPWRYSGIGYLHKNVLPPWVSDLETGEMLVRLRQPEVRGRIRQDIASGLAGWTNSAKARGWANHTIVYSADRDLLGLNLQELARPGRA